MKCTPFRVPVYLPEVSWGGAQLAAVAEVIELMGLGDALTQLGHDCCSAEIEELCIHRSPMSASNDLQAALVF